MVKCDELGREPYESERVRIEEIEGKGGIV